MLTDKRHLLLNRIHEIMSIMRREGRHAFRHLDYDELELLTSLLADPEAIARAAVREFAEALSQSLMISSRVRGDTTAEALRLIEKLAAERGVELNTNQQPRSEK